MVFNGLRIYADLALFYCSACPSLHIIFWDIVQYYDMTYNMLWYRIFESRPPDPWIYYKIRSGAAIFLIFLSVSMTVMQMNVKKWRAAFETWTLQNFQECNQFMEEDDSYYFDCYMDHQDMQQHISNSLKETQLCSDCHPDYDNFEIYHVKLPAFQQAHLAAFQHNNDFGVYTTFDTDTDVCVY